MGPMGSFRIGHGYDVHRLVPRRKLILGGVEIPWEMGLDGHSDADVLCHAISDALLGAVALGDIGTHFPPGDPAYKDANSLALLEQVGQMLGNKGWRVGNLDATLVAQQPRMAPHLLQMRQNVAKALGIEMDAVSIKATTEEGLGFTGTGQGMAAHCVVLVQRI
jgi:2-C-methyl-D-erythritol 2,4-cyclodiphosphate synthase